MIRRTVRIQLGVFVVITALGILYLGFQLIGLDALRPATSIHARFASSGGIFTNAEVTYRGVGVGRVGKLKLQPDGVDVELKLDHGVQVPADTIAVIANKSAVGEQYVDFQPRTAGGRMLRDGDVIPIQDTRVPIDIQTVVIDLDRLARGIDKVALGELINGLGTAFEGTAPAIQRLLDAGGELTKTLQAELPDTLALIRDGKIVLDTARQTQGDLRRFASGLADLAESLKAADPDVRRLLDNGIQAAREIEALLTPQRAAIAQLLGDLTTVNRLNVIRVDGLRQVLVSLPTVVKEGPESLADGTLHNGLVTELVEAPACNYGTPRRVPRDYSPTEPPLEAQCPPGTSGQRGAEYAPHPGDAGTGSGSGSSADGKSAPSAAAGGPARVGSGSSAASYRAAMEKRLGQPSWLALLTALL